MRVLIIGKCLIWFVMIGCVNCCGMSDCVSRKLLRGWVIWIFLVFVMFFVVGWDSVLMIIVRFVLLVRLCGVRVNVSWYDFF